MQRLIVVDVPEQLNPELQTVAVSFFERMLIDLRDLSLTPFEGSGSVEALKSGDLDPETFEKGLRRLIADNSYAALATHSMLADKYRYPLQVPDPNTLGYELDIQF